MLLTLPATAAQLNAQVLDPLFLNLLPGFDSPEARVMLVAIALQESGLTTRQQEGGPAHGLWQNEMGGMVQGVLASASTAAQAFHLCQACKVAPQPQAVYAALLEDDLLAAGFARLGLWADPHPLPALGDPDDAWTEYCSVWRPGKPRLNDWPANYAAAMGAL